MKFFQSNIQNLINVFSIFFTQSKVKSFDGKYIKGVYNGKGTKELKDESVYEGEFKNNKMHGYGKIFFKDGSIYQGNFKNNHRDGTGISRNKDGSQQRVIYQNGKFKEVYSEDYTIYWKNTVEGALEVNAENPSKAVEIFYSLSKDELLKKSELNTNLKKIKVTDIETFSKEETI